MDKNAIETPYGLLDPRQLTLDGAPLLSFSYSHHHVYTSADQLVYIKLSDLHCHAHSQLYRQAYVSKLLGEDHFYRRGNELEPSIFMEENHGTRAPMEDWTPELVSNVLKSVKRLNDLQVSSDFTYSLGDREPEFEYRLEQVKDPELKAIATEWRHRLKSNSWLPEERILIHGDINEANFVLNQAGVIRLIDLESSLLSTPEYDRATVVLALRLFEVSSGKPLNPELRQVVLDEVEDFESFANCMRIKVSSSFAWAAWKLGEKDLQDRIEIAREYL